VPIGTNIFRAARILGGGVIGGAIGGIASGSNTGTGWATDVARGAAIGAGIGLASFAIPSVPAGKLAKAKWLASGGKRAGKVALGTGLLGVSIAGVGLKTGIGVGRFALRHPAFTIAGLGGGGLAMYGLARSGPQNANRSVDEMARMAEYQGNPSTGFSPGEGSTRAAFEQSTEGLVQGLHRSRHR
jgi:hypothetical protein